MNTCIARSAAGAKTELMRPLFPDGFWALDVHVDDFFLAMNWRAGDGFLLTSRSTHGYGEGADEVYRDFSDALPRVLHLIQNKLETVPSYPVRMKELREERGVSQAESAEWMGVQQAAVSKLESREDTHLGTLSNSVRSLGGRLVLKAVFPDREQEVHLTATS
jgi:DNA-binding XRE family transcriptional regulator